LKGKRHQRSISLAIEDQSNLEASKTPAVPRKPKVADISSGRTTNAGKSLEAANSEVFQSGVQLKSSGGRLAKQERHTSLSSQAAHLSKVQEARQKDTRLVVFLHRPFVLLRPGWFINDS